MRRHLGKTLVGLVVTVLALWYVLRGQDFGEIIVQMRQGDPLLLLAAVVVATSGFFVRALRWKIILTPVKADTGLRSRFAAVSIGFMANNVLPARVGEFARAYAFSRMEPVSASAAFGSLVVERFLDGVVLLLLLVVPILLPGFPAGGALSTGMGALILRGGILAVGLVMAALVVMALWPRLFIRVAERGASLLPRAVARPVVDALESLLDSISLLRSPRLLSLSFLWTLGFWLFHGLSFWLAMMAFGIDTGLVSAWFTEAVVGFGVALPAAPGFIGTFHASAAFALTGVYGVESSRSLAFAFGFWFAGWVPINVIGFWYAWKLGLSLGDVGAAEERVEDIIEGEHPAVGRILGQEGP
ncbi:MAG TPA: lysylphosphatidylglycerol synthase transmembrane domain-containing protein [Longimicrobiales bacterium]|nr:lysylphosphatidylglycerol synthase transmembrane domain-containing protein [Longimicrobiales bacterium]